ncbi:MAG: MCE family protein [Acidimicrobiales bacterium]
MIAGLWRRAAGLWRRMRGSSDEAMPEHSESRIKQPLAGRARLSRKQIKTTAKLVAFTLAGLVLIGYMAMELGNISFFASRVTYHAQLANVTGLVPTDPVKIAGVTVGEVNGITTQHGHALVTMSVDRNVPLRAGTDVGLQWHNVIGQQYLYLYPSKTGAVLKPGTIIPLSHDVSNASVGALLNTLGPFLQSINASQANAVVTNILDAVQGNGAQIDQLISSSATVSKSVGALDVQVGSMIDNLQQVVGALASRSGSVSQVIGNLAAVSHTLASRNSLLDSTVVNLSTVAGELANLLKTNKDNLSGIIADLDSVTAQIQSKDVPLATGLQNIGQGLAPFQEISSYGQWFELKTVYTCLANQTGCSYYEPLNPPADSGLLGSPAGGGFPGTSGGASRLGSVLGQMAGGLKG